jgi:hypothetical protein
MSLDQQIRVVTKYIENNPEKMHANARVVILMAYRDGFPCPEKK